MMDLHSDIWLWGQIYDQATGVLADFALPMTTPILAEKAELQPLHLTGVLQSYILSVPELRLVLSQDVRLHNAYVDEMQKTAVELHEIYQSTCRQLRSSENSEGTRRTLRQLLLQEFRSSAQENGNVIVAARAGPTNAGSCVGGDMVVVLTNAYSHSAYPTRAERDRLGRACGMTSKQVTTWFANARQRGLTRAESKRKRRSKPYETLRKISSTSTSSSTSSRTSSSMPSLSSSTSSSSSPSSPSTSSPAFSRSFTTNSSLSLSSSACTPLNLAQFDSLLQKPIDQILDNDFISSFVSQENALHPHVQIVDESQQLLPPLQIDQSDQIMDFQLPLQTEPFNIDTWLRQNVQPQPSTSTNIDLTWLPTGSTSLLLQQDTNVEQPTFDFSDLINLPRIDDSISSPAVASTLNDDSSMHITNTFWQDIMQTLGIPPHAQAATVESLQLQDTTTSSLSCTSLPTSAITDPCGYLDSVFSNAIPMDMPTLAFSLQPQL